MTPEVAARRDRNARPSTAWAVVLDFDGTVTRKDVADSILARFGGVTEAEILASCDPCVTTEDWVRARFAKVREPLSVIRRFVLSTASHRPGFPGFLCACRAAGIPVEIVSGGVDFYIDILLDEWEAGRVRRFRAASRSTRRGIAVDYSYLGGRRLDAFKAWRVESHQRLGRRVLFAGDGTSDFLAARTADAAFATGALWRRCRENDIPVRRFVSFHGLSRYLCIPS